MRFDIYGKFQLEVRRENDTWVVYRWAPGMRTPCDDVIIPPSMESDEISTYLDDIYHELAGAEDRVTLVCP